MNSSGPNKLLPSPRNARPSKHPGGLRRRLPRGWSSGIGTGRLPARVHTGGCWDTGHRCAPAAAEQIRRLLAEGVPRASTADRTPPWACWSERSACGRLSAGRRGRAPGALRRRDPRPRPRPRRPTRVPAASRPGPNAVRLDDPLLIEWCGGGPTVWSPDTGQE
ncbi:DUF6233 domain-containing protein [Streptomyces sp. NPDC059957]|uniref:DUF6233 domain-containing protein n=1 Tax=Streptomyces sp. NPDC059957 TaxID=3347016 RepID=UPI00365B76AB